MPLEGGVNRMNEVLMNRAVDITRLKPNTTILLSTSNNVYEITVAEPGIKLCYITSSERFRTTTEVTVLGSLHKGQSKPGWIEIGSSIEIAVNANKVITTGPVETAKIIAADKSYSYEL